MKKLILSFLFLFSGIGLFAQGYKIECKIDKVETQEIYMAYHLGSKQYLKDTAQLANGIFTFQGDEPLESGVYLIAVPPQNTYFEILIDKDNQSFRVETEHPDFNANMKVSGSEGNKIFYDYVQYLGKMRGEAKTLQEKMQDPEASEKDIETTEKELETLNQTVKDYQSEVINRPGNLFVSKMLKANQEIEIPEPPKNDDGTIDSTFR